MRRITPVSDVLELSRFRVADESEERFLASYPACAQALHRFEGFKDVSLAKLDDGSYIFVGVWAKREHCQAAMETAMEVEAIAGFLSHISEEISMEYGDVVELDRGVAAAA
jgi:heme-degrading monooxygenase HmoA